MRKLLTDFHYNRYQINNSIAGTMVYSESDVTNLLAHAEALETWIDLVRNDPMLTLRVQQVWEADALLHADSR